MDIEFRELLLDDITVDLFEKFNRFQAVTQCWRKIENEWLLKDIPFTENWGQAEKLFLTGCLQNTINTNGAVFGAFKNDVLVGFASLESNCFGSHLQYLQLTSIHITYELRGYGVGKKLFRMICERAKEMGAKKLYISSHSSKETQAFYRKIGCVDALEINKEIADKEPCDCQLEFDLASKSI